MTTPPDDGIKSLPLDYEYLAPDTSEIRLLVRGATGSVAGSEGMRSRLSPEAVANDAVMTVQNIEQCRQGKSVTVTQRSTEGRP